MKKIIALVLAVMMTACCMPLNSMAGYASGAEPPSQFVDGNRMSDEEFLGKWDSNAGAWEVEGKLDYSYAPELAVVEEYVKENDYYNAREALLHYYKNKNLQYEEYATRDPIAARLQYEGILDFETTHVSIFRMNTGESWYDFDVTSAVASGKDAFLLTSMKKDTGEDGTEQLASFYSKEAGANAPVLEITRGTNTIQVPVDADMYLRAGVYSAANSGAEDRILVSDGGDAPYDNATRQGYVRFKYDGYIDTSLGIDKATLKLYGDTTEDGKELLLSVAAENVWDENKVCFSDVAGRVASYNNDPDAYDWKIPPGAHSQFRNVQIRLWKLPALFAEYNATKEEKYAERAIQIYLDFIKDDGGLRYDTYGTERTLNAAFRGDPSAVQCFFNAVNTNAIDGVAFTSMLKFMWQEPDAITDPFFESAQINLNGLAFAIDSLLYYSTYFPEFKDRDKWVKRTQQRILEFADQAIYDDGGYVESTSGYDVSVLRSTNKFYDIAEMGGIEVPEAFTEKYRKFGVAEMNLTRPDKLQWQWGDGGAVSPKGAIVEMAERLGDKGELLYFATDGADGTMPEYTSYFLPTSKLGVMRSSWNANNSVAMFLIGKIGGSHGHADMNSVSMYAYGRHLLVDLGVSSYDSRHPAVAWQSSRTESHNSVEVNEIGQARTTDKQSVVSMYTNKNADFYTGRSEAYDDVTHTRKVSFIKDKKFFIVSDYLQPVGDQMEENRYNQTWQTATTGSWRMDDPATGVAQTEYSSGANVLMVPVSPEGLTSASLDLNPMEKRHLSYKINTADNAKFNTIVYPFENEVGEVTAKEVAVTDNADQSASAFEMTLPDRSRAVYFVNYNTNLKRGFSDYDVDAAAFYLEKDSNGAMDTLAASEVRRVSKSGQTMLESNQMVTDISVTYGNGTAEVAAPETLDLTKDYLAFHAPGVLRVRCNEQEIPFMRQGDTVIVGMFSEEYLTTTNQDNTRSAVLPELSFTYPLVYGSDEKNAVLTIQDGTRITGPAGWDGVVQISALQESDEKLGNGAYGVVRTNHNFELDRPMRISYAFSGGRGAWKSKTGGWLQPEASLSQNSFSAAASTLNDMVQSAYYDGNGESGNYANLLSDIILYSVKSSVEPGKPDTGKRPSGGHVGGSSGGGPNVIPEATATPSPSAMPEITPAYQDISGHWAEKDILYLSQQGYVNGYGDEFRPDQTITRAEAATILARMTQAKKGEEAAPFSDVSADAWYADSVAIAYQAGLINGFEDGTFRPDEWITRAQLTKMVVETYRYMGGKVPDEAGSAAFTDAEAFEAWAISYINAAVELGLISGDPDGSFRADDTATRAETVRMLYNMLQLLL